MKRVLIVPLTLTNRPLKTTSSGFAKIENGVGLFELNPLLMWILDLETLAGLG
jgi:hypothetical protein